MSDVTIPATRDRSTEESGYPEATVARAGGPRRRVRAGDAVRGTIRRPGSGQARVLLLLLLVLTSIWRGAVPVVGQPATPAAGCVAAVEPNDQPADAIPLPGGAACADATVTTSAQDLYRWEVPAGTSRWSLALTGIPGQVVRLEVYTVELDGAGEVVTATKLLSHMGGAGEAVAFDNLLWTPGAYYVGVATSGPGSYHLTAAPGDGLPDAATGASGPFAASGEGTSSLVWTLDDIAIRDRYTLALQGPVGGTLSLQLADADGQTLAQLPAGPDGISALPDIGLPAGDYTLAVSSNEQDMPWIVSAVAQGARAPGQEDEPNESGAAPMPLALDGDTLSLNGRLALGGGAEGTSDRDVYRITIDAGHAGRFTDIRLLWQGEVERRLCLLDTTDTALRCVTGASGTAINDLILAEGEYLIAVSGVSAPDVPYLLRIDVTGEAVSGFEREPNDQFDRASPLAPQGETFVGSGRLASEDTDHFSLTVAGEPQLWRMDLLGEPDTRLMLLDATGSTIMTSDVGPNGPVISDAYLVPGDHLVRVEGSGDYTLTLTPLGPPDPQQEREPNGTLDRSQPIRLSETRTGRFVTSGDADVYRFSLQGETTVTVSVVPPADGQIALELEWQGTPVTTAEAAAPGEPTLWSGTLQAGDYALWLQPRVPSEERYEVRIDPVDPFATPGGTPAAQVAVTLDLGATPVAAYWPEAQRVDGTVRLENTGGGEIEVTLDARTGNQAWEVTLDRESVTVAPGETETVPVSVLVAPDAHAAEPIYVAVRADAPEGTASTLALLTPDGQAPPRSPEAWWPLPDDVLGGIDVAGAAAGGSPVAVDEIAVTEQLPLYDDLPTAGTGWRTDVATLPAELTVDLTGDDPVPIAGFAIQAAGIEPWPGAWPREVEFQLSIDGQVFETAWSGALAPVAGEQAFALDTLVDARFARLRILTPQDPTAAGVSLGGWKVIASPGWELAGERNLADPVVGGHLVDLQPPLSDPLWQRELLLPGDVAQWVTAMPGESIAIVIGFQHDRAAQLTGLEWIDPPGSDPAQRLDRVSVEVSTGSPLGPWEPVADWPLERDGASSATLTFDTPVWARFLRLTAPVPGEGDVPIDVELPDVLRAIERPAGEGYLSITGEWGGDRQPAVYERLVPATRPEPGTDAGNDAEAASMLPPGETRADIVAIGEDEDWYRVELPGDATDLAVTIGGVPAIGVTVDLFDEGGDPVETGAEQVSATELLVTATGPPGAAYLLRVTQPPTSVVIAFDTSFSIGMLERPVYQGLDRFATDVQPGREFVNVLPFGESEPLMADFSDDAYLIQGAVAAYPRGTTSSDAEGAILTANEALKGRPGTRAIVLITDGESAPSMDQLAQLWPELAATGPRIFTVGIAGSDQPERGRDVMQDWAAVGGGYVYVRDQGAMDVAFARIATELRRPALYTVTAEASVAPATPTPAPTPAPTPTPEPSPTPTPVPATPLPNGRLLVTAPVAASVPGQPVPVAGAVGQVAIILDTSGSMLQPIGDGTRADVARTALIDLVTTTIPPGTTVSLRTFGDTPDSCETLLAVPPGPLNPAAMATTIAGLPVVDRVRTPIGASLEATLVDLASGSGPKIVVLVTDGEETCGGDPAAAIQALVDSGADVRVNIVGFAIDDAALAETFAQWARLGNGRYIDAGNAAELNAAVAAAVQPTFNVIDATGTVVAWGQVGVAISLPPGEYQVVIHASTEVTIDVTVVSGEETAVPVPPP